MQHHLERNDDVECESCDAAPLDGNAQQAEQILRRYDVLNPTMPDELTVGPGQAGQADAAYGPNASRLLAIKRRYDPRNVFSATLLPSSA